MVKLSSEIISGALMKAGVYNVDFLTALTLTNALNDSYRQAYSMIAASSSDYRIKELTLEADEDGLYSLPIDCSLVKTIKRRGNIISRCPPKEEVSGTYKISNSRIKIYDDAESTIDITYVPVPETITTPAQSIELNINWNTVTQWGKMTSKGVYFKSAEFGESYYNFETKQIEPASFIEASADYNGYKLVWDAQSILLMDGAEVVADYSDDYQIIGNDFTAVVVDDPYAMISYADGTIIVAQFDRWQTIWNIKAKTGHATKGKVGALKTNDSTLYGCIFEDKDEQRYYLASFVPDTALNYPNNTLFTLMEAELAVLAASINGQLDIGWLKDYRDEAREQFIKELKQDSIMPIRISNLRRRY